MRQVVVSLNFIIVSVEMLSIFYIFLPFAFSPGPELIVDVGRNVWTLNSNLFSSEQISQQSD